MGSHRNEHKSKHRWCEERKSGSRTDHEVIKVCSLHAIRIEYAILSVIFRRKISTDLVGVRIVRKSGLLPPSLANKLAALSIIRVGHWGKPSLRQLTKEFQTVFGEFFYHPRDVLTNGV